MNIERIVLPDIQLSYNQWTDELKVSSKFDPKHNNVPQGHVFNTNKIKQSLKTSDKTGTKRKLWVG